MTDTATDTNWDWKRGHYKGPWQEGERKRWRQSIHAPKGGHWEFAKVVMRVEGATKDIPEAAANLRLLVKAPEMYEALAEFIRWNAKRELETDEILAPEYQYKEIENAMYLLAYIDGEIPWKE